MTEEYNKVRITEYEGRYTSFDGTDIFYKKWSDGYSEHKGAIQIIHGLGEMAYYYDELAEYAVGQGFVVYLNEARGHGRTGQQWNSDEDIITQMVRDALVLKRSIIDKESDTKEIYLIGHSLGSLISQLLVSQYQEEWKGVILTGMPYFEDVSAVVDTVLREINENGEDAPCKEAFEMIFAGVNESFTEKDDALAWLTGDEERREYYSGLQYTNVAYSNRFYRDFLGNAQNVQNGGGISQLEKKDFPVAIYGGERDVVSRNGRYGAEVAVELENEGFSDVFIRIYPEMRHSIFQETERRKVFEDVIAWIGIRAAGTSEKTSKIYSSQYCGSQRC